MIGNKNRGALGLRPCQVLAWRRHTVGALNTQWWAVRRLGCNLIESDNLSHSVSLNMNRLRIFKGFELLQINANIFLFQQSKIDEGKAFTLEEHLGRINRYSSPRSPATGGGKWDLQVERHCVEGAPSSAGGEHALLFHLPLKTASWPTHCI